MSGEKDAPMSGRRHRPRLDLPVQDARVEGETELEVPPEEQAPPSEDQKAARATAVTRASLSLAPKREGVLYGSPAFFNAAADQLAMSTRYGLELAGAVYAKTVGGRTLLVGLQRRGSGKPGRVAVSPEWGRILWHTHPGLRGSLAAFSQEDIEAAKLCKRPLLVIGFGGLSPEVLSTLTLPLGVRGLLVSSGVKGLMALEKTGRLRERLLRIGVAARVCYPSGRIEPVIRTHAPPIVHAIEDMSFVIDRGIGAAERLGQRALKAIVGTVVGRRG